MSTDSTVVLFERLIRAQERTNELLERIAKAMDAERSPLRLPPPLPAGWKDGASNDVPPAPTAKPAAWPKACAKGHGGVLKRGGKPWCAECGAEIKT